jgi:hypothetical protein
MPLDSIEELKAKVLLYEQNGAAKLYYSLNRKMNEMADIMNKNTLGDLDLNDPKDKTFERLKVIWNDAASIATAVKELGMAAGVTGVEDIDVNKKPFVDTIAQSRG